MLKTTIATLAILVLTSCASKNKELLVGKWQEVGTGSSIMNYDSDGTYHYNHDDGTNATGKWRIDGITLYTKEEGETIELSEEVTTLDSEIMVSNVAGMYEVKYARIK